MSRSSSRGYLGCQATANGQRSQLRGSDRDRLRPRVGSDPAVAAPVSVLGLAPMIAGRRRGCCAVDWPTGVRLCGRPAVAAWLILSTMRELRVSSGDVLWPDEM